MNEHEDKPACELCQDSGLLAVRDPDGTGTVVCDCQREQITSRIRENLWKASEVPVIHQNLTFADFDKAQNSNKALGLEEREGLVQSNQDLLDTCRKLARSVGYRTTFPWLLLCGGYGSGKTLLLYIIAGELVADLQEVIYCHTLKLISNLKRGYRDGSHAALLERISSVPYLLLDDIALRDYNPSTEDLLSEILGQRYAERLPTVITSRWTPEELEKKLPLPLFSRIMDVGMTRVAINTSPDYRPWNVRGVENDAR